MLLLLNIFEGGQHGHPLSVGHLRRGWPTSMVHAPVDSKLVLLDRAGDRTGGDVSSDSDEDAFGASSTPLGAAVDMIATEEGL